MILSPTTYGEIRELTRAESILSYTLAHQGGTFRAGDGRPVSPDHGYWISERNAELELTPESLESRLQRIEAYCANVCRSQPFSHVGTWIDPDGRIFLDTSTHWGGISESRAREIGRIQGQRAVWDCAAGRAVTC